MKIKYFAAIIMTMAMAIPTHTFAMKSDITVKSDAGETAFSYDPAQSDSAVREANGLFEEFGEYKSVEPKANKIYVTYSGNNEYDVELKLRLSTSPDAESDKRLNYYDFVVLDNKSKVLYNSAEEFDAISGDAFKDISITTLSDKVTDEEYTVIFSKGADSKNVDLSDLTLSIYTKRANKATPVVTPKPKFDLNATPEPNKSFIFDMDDEQKAEIIDMLGGESNDDGTEGDAEKDSKTIIKYCEKDIPAGRYIVSGNGLLKIKSSNGAVKTEVVIADETHPEIKGERTYVVLLEAGDVIEINPLEGDEKARLKFDTATTDASGNTVGRVNDTNKTNPKTGDDNSYIGVTIGVIALAAAAFAGLEILKKKKKS